MKNTKQQTEHTKFDCSCIWHGTRNLTTIEHSSEKLNSYKLIVWESLVKLDLFIYLTVYQLFVVI